MTIAELQRGPGANIRRATDAPWQVLIVKPFGVNSGLLVADGKNDLYLLRFDPRLATRAWRLAPRWWRHASSTRSATSSSTTTSCDSIARASSRTIRTGGLERRQASRARHDDIDAFLTASANRLQARRTGDRHTVPERREGLLGPYQVWGTRSDDPNDIVAHEHRRDLRGLSVFAAWLNISNLRAVGTQDILTTVDERQLADPSFHRRSHEIARQRSVRRARSWPGRATKTHSRHLATSDATSRASVWRRPHG